jgi:hypothetical protein
MKQNFVVLLIISILSNICLADDIIFLEKDKPAPHEGYLFTPEKTKETRIKLLERNTFEGLNLSLTNTNTFLQKNIYLKDYQIQIVTDRNTELSKTIIDQRSASDLQKVLWFGLGVLATGAALYGIKKISQ